MGKILEVCTSERKGIGKTPVSQGEFVVDFGIKGDAHAGNWHRQVSLLAAEGIEEFRRRGGKVEFGDFGENLIIEGIDLINLPIGTQLKCGEVIMEMTQIGKECHTRCNIFHQVGDCIMPRQGVFTKVLKGGIIKKGDFIDIINIK